MASASKRVSAASVQASETWLIGDIGGTNARFALVGPTGATVEMSVLACADYPGLVDAIEAYVAGVSTRPNAAAIAIASPVAGDRVAMTNHHWSFSIEDTRRALGFNALDVVNDFTAMALSVPALGSDDSRAIGGGKAVAGAPIAVIGPGTGLGVSGLVPSADGWIPLATEGGHATLPAFDDRERTVIAWLAAKFDHVSIERAVSGMGLVNLATAIAALDGAPAPAADPAAITDAALDGSDPVAAEALSMFCAMLGTAASNLALSLGAKGGVYIAGGIVPKLGEAFDRSPFRARFEDKGRFGPYLAAIPTRVITRDEPALLGLATLARERIAR